jgi:hypothetical protein
MHGQLKKKHNSTYSMARISQHWEKTPNNERLPCLHFNQALSIIFVIMYSSFSKIYTNESQKDGSHRNFQDAFIKNTARTY